jgi:hypothetical protein
MTAAQIAQGITQREAQLHTLGIRVVQPGPADSSIYDEENGHCIATDMELVGVGFVRANKAPGTRKIRHQKLRSYLQAAGQHPMEEPGLFVFETCRQFIRTVPTIQRHNRDPDEIADGQEDHILDETEYMLLHEGDGVVRRGTTGY